MFEHLRMVKLCAVCFAFPHLITVLLTPEVLGGLFRNIQQKVLKWDVPSSTINAFHMLLT